MADKGKQEVLGAR